MARGSSSRGRRPTALPRPPPPPSPPPLNMFEDSLNMFADLQLGQDQCTIPGSSHSNGAPILKPQFFRVIGLGCPPSVNLRKLMIPPSFTNEHGSSLLDHAFLRAPKGKEHRIKLIKDECGNVWFSRGWEDFANCYSLAIGSFLVFRYEGSSRFHVSVFDTSCFEIEYPNFITETMEEDEDADEKEEEVEAEDADDDIEEEQVNVGEDRINEAEKRARDFKCDPGNPSFACPMRTTYLTGDFRLWVPAEYAQDHMMKAKNNKIYLQLKEESRPEVWPVKFTCENPVRGRLTTVRLTKGWRSFAEDNELKVGDACVFELIDNQTKIYRVHIFRMEP